MIHVMAVDTETELIAARTSLDGTSGEEQRSGKVLTSPWVTPRISLGSWATMDARGVEPPEALRLRLLSALLEPDVHLVCHNLPFDYGVMAEAFPELREPFLAAAGNGRLHDTKTLDQLYGLAVGRYDKPKYDPVSKKWAQTELRPRSLEVLAQEYCGMTLNKDPNIRLAFGQFIGRFQDVPADFRAYALQDAVATLRVFRELERRLAGIGAKNWLSEASQIRMALVNRDLDGRGVHIDRRLAGELRHRFVAMVEPLEQQLAAAGLGRYRPVPKSIRLCEDPQVFALPVDKKWHLRGDKLVRGRGLKAGNKYEEAMPAFSLDVKALQRAMGALPGAGEAPRRADGTIGLEHDFWATKVPPTELGLCTWLEHQKLSKVLSTYLNVYARVPERIFPRWWELGARTGRESASCPSVQNVPRSKFGIRALFVPAPGMVFTRGDFKAQEMFTLCEFMIDRGIQGPLYDVLTSGKDIHKYAASLVLRKPMDQVTKEERQGQKALNFGCPGGLGPKTLAEYAYTCYGVLWTEAEAKERRTAFLEAFEDIESYLQSMKRGQDFLLRKVSGLGRKDWAEALETEDWNVLRAMALHANPEIAAIGQEAERQNTVEISTGFRRANCRFSEAANCGFQSLAAAVLKEAAWRCFRAGLHIVLCVHDEIVVQRRPEETSVPKILEECMLGAFRAVCPHIGHAAGVEIEDNLRRWGKATDGKGQLLDIPGCEL
jgi:DNA polymerase I-like protein with 3'-5' exonuclease and polymerase domains